MQMIVEKNNIIDSSNLTQGLYIDKIATKDGLHKNRKTFS